MTPKIDEKTAVPVILTAIPMVEAEAAAVGLAVVRALVDPGKRSFTSKQV